MKVSPSKYKKINKIIAIKKLVHPNLFSSLTIRISRSVPRIDAKKKETANNRTSNRLWAINQLLITRRLDVTQLKLYTTSIKTSNKSENAIPRIR